MKEMIGKILGSLGLNDEEAQAPSPSSRRKHQRLSGEGTVLMLDDKTFTIGDWSQNGVFINATHSGLALGDSFDFILKFKLPHDTIAVLHKARVVRTTRQGIAAEFAPLTDALQRQFRRALDGFYSQNFSNSQAVA